MAAESRNSTVLILGGGIGGVVTANRLRKTLDKRHRILLVNREVDFSYAASYLWVMTGTRKPEQITRPLHHLRTRGIEVIIGGVEKIDPVTKSVVVDGAPIEADYLVVSLGAKWATDRIPGLADFGYTFATLPGAQLLAKELESIDSGRITVVTAAPLYKCPAAPYEAALLIDAGLRKRGIRQRVEVAVRSAESAPMPVAGANVSAAVEQMLAQRDIEYISAKQITAVEQGTIHFGDNSEPSDLLVYMPTIASPSVIANSALAATDGWIHSDPSTLETDFEGVYAIGDNTQIGLKIGKPLPRAGVFAHAQGLVVADRIAASIAGKQPSAQFDGHGGCWIETGTGKAAYGSGNFYADPAPLITLHSPAKRWHWGKAIFEMNVMRRWL